MCIVQARGFSCTFCHQTFPLGICVAKCISYTGPEPCLVEGLLGLQCCLLGTHWTYQVKDNWWLCGFCRLDGIKGRYVGVGGIHFHDAIPASEGAPRFGIVDLDSFLRCFETFLAAEPPQQLGVYAAFAQPDQREHRPEYRPEHQRERQREHQPEHQLEHEPKYQPERQSEHQPEHEPKHQPERQREHQPEQQPEHQCERQREHQPEHHPEHEPKHHPEHQPECQREHQPEYKPERQPEHQLEQQHESQPESQRENQLKHQREHQPEYPPERQHGKRFKFIHVNFSYIEADEETPRDLELQNQSGVGAEEHQRSPEQDQENHQQCY